MRDWLSSAAGVLVLLVASVSGQTASDIELKYGKPVSAYPVAQYIWMTPEYARDGQVCRMRLYPKRVSGDTSTLINQLPFKEFNDAVEELVPPGTRGAKKAPFGGGSWTFGGGMMWATFDYEKVTITFWASFRVDAEALKNFKSEPFDLSAKEVELLVKKSEGASRPGDDFLPYHKSGVELVVIKWNGRTCAGN